MPQLRHACMMLQHCRIAVLQTPMLAIGHHMA
jgi:hypothetical protein